MFLQRYGTVNRAIFIDRPESQYHKMRVVEFESGSALTLLSGKLPFAFTTNTGKPCLIKSVSQVYTTEIGTSKTKTYFADLQNVAKLSGKDFTEVLQEMMAQISGSIAELPAKAGPTAEAITNSDPPKMAATTSSLPETAPATRPKMALDVERKIKMCGRCVRRKALPDKSAPLVNIISSRPLELLCMDFLSQTQVTPETFLF